MKLTDEMIERAWRLCGYEASKYCDSHSFRSFTEGFKAAFDILLPIIEKQNEALEFYKDEFLYKYGDGDYMEIFKDEGKRARSTLAFVEQEIKKIEADK